jgi:hypothetical protein
VRVGSLRLEDEDGQSLVLTVGFLFGIVLMLALVVNVGFWLQAQRRAQNVADAVALAIASNAPSTGACSGDPTWQAIGNCYANLNWSQFTTGGNVTIDPPVGSSVTVHVTHSVPGFFTSLIGAAFSTVTVGAHATATVQAPETLDNSQLTTIAQTPTYVAPIVVRDVACGTPPWNPGCLGAPEGVNLLENTIAAPNARDGSFIDFVDLACAVPTVGCQNPSAVTIASQITGSPPLTGAIQTGAQLPVVPVSVLDSCPNPGNRCTIRAALASVVGKTLIAIASDQPVAGVWHAVGFVALTITSVPSNNAWRRPGTRARKMFVVKFQSFTPTPTLSGSGVAPAFGVQTLGLTR